MTDVVPEQPPASNRGLWMLVIGLGIAILIVVAAMIAMAVRNMMRKDAAATAPHLTSQAVVLKPGEIPELNVDLDPGAAVADAKLDGTTLVVRITAPDGDQVLIIEPSTSKVVSRIRFNRKAAASPAQP
jgi:ABC-type lipoprotein release transport system permease subunit